jgi:uncharacterized glyoxalase superfamily protein PhnB
MVETISREQLAWLAGILDGEGSLEVGWTNQYRKDKARLPTKMMYCRIKVGNTDVFMIREISRIYSGLRVGFSYRTYKKSNSRYWVIDIKTQGKGNCRKLINAVYPYLITKIQQADKMLEIITYRESVGYGGFRAKYNPNYKPLEQDETLIRLIEELKALKKPQVEPSTTKRRANRILGLMI